MFKRTLCFSLHKSCGPPNDIISFFGPRIIKFVDPWIRMMHSCMRAQSTRRNVYLNSMVGFRRLAEIRVPYFNPGILLKLTTAPSNQLVLETRKTKFMCKSYRRFNDEEYYWMQFAKDPVFGHFITINAPTRHDASRDGRYSVRSGTLTIKKVDITDGGRYRCIATQARLQWSAYLLVMST